MDPVAEDPLAGTSISRYRLLGRLGSGGMGVVYEAEDEELGRRVAIKLLAAELAGFPVAMDRFKREARAASALSHPHICAVHDVGIHEGRPYLVMERLSGRTLRQEIAGRPMAVDRALALAEQIADGLDAAHRAGIVHRDLKPANLFVTERGEAKILDFGTAKVLPGESGASPDAVAALDPLTESGTAVGTVAYMSPEQARGEPVDARSDLFSLGVVLYEMLTGRPAFQGTSAAERFKGILADTPDPPSRFNPAVSDELDRIVLGALEKDPQLRPASSAALVAELRRAKGGGPVSVERPPSEQSLAASAPAYLLAKPRSELVRALGIAAVAVAAAVVTGGLWLGREPAPPAASSLAVLPLANTGGDAGLDYLGEGVAERVIARLAQLPGLKVMARSSAFRFEGRQSEPVSVGRELQVDAVLTGRVVPGGDTARLELELVDVGSGARLWGETYVVRPAALGAVEEEIASRVAARLGLGVLAAAGRAPMDPEAHTLFLKGRYQLNKRTPDGFRQARVFFDQALERDPEQAVLHAGLAEAWALIGAYSVLPPSDSFPRAIAAARNALRLDVSLAEARVVLALCTFLYEWSWDEAEAEFRRATESQPGHAIGHHWYAEYLMARGRTDEAVAALDRARELDPLSLVIAVDVGRAYYFGRRFPEARSECERALAVSPDFVPAIDCLAMVATEEGRYDESVARYQEVSRLWGADSGLPGQTMALARAGRRAEAEALWARLAHDERSGYTGQVPLALVQAALGRTDDAFRLLEAARLERSDKLTYLKTDPRADSLRADPRWAELAGRVGL